MPACSRPLLLAIMAGLPISGHAAQPAWPTPEETARAREAQPFPAEERLKRVPLPAMPRIAPAPAALDLAAIAQRHGELKIDSSAASAAPELRIFISLSMPQASLRLLVAQAERAGATLLLRGLKANSMQQTLAAVQTLIGERKVRWQIDPQTYTRYGVRQAPTFVLTPAANAGAGNAGSCGSTCATGAGFYSVAGDVSLDYALHTLARRYPDAERLAAPYLQRLRPTP